MGRCGASRRSLATVFIATLLVSFAVLSSAAKSRDVDQSDDDFEGASGPSSTDCVGLGDKLYAVEGRLLVGSSEEDPREGLKLLQQSSSPARVILYGNGNQQEVLTTRDGYFRFKDVPPGAYLLEVVSNTWVYPKVRVDVSSRHNGKIKAKVATETQVGAVLNYPLSLRPLGPMKFFEERPGFQFLGLLKNPMILMMGVTLLMSVLLPKLMSSEAMKELQPQQQSQSNQPEPAQVLQKWISTGPKEKKKNSSSSS